MIGWKKLVLDAQKLEQIKQVFTYIMQVSNPHIHYVRNSIASNGVGVDIDHPPHSLLAFKRDLSIFDPI
jgi:hypothetical protein